MPLVTTKDMFKKAYEGHYAVGAFNVNNMEIVQGIVDAAKEEESPLILQVPLVPVNMPSTLICFTSSRRPLKIRICPLPSILTMVLISKSAKPVLMAVLRPS